MSDLNKCTLCNSDAKCESGFSPCESTEYAYCSNKDCMFHLIEDSWFTKNEWNHVNKPELTPMQKCAPKMYEMLQKLRAHYNFSEYCENEVDALLAKARGES